MVALTVIRPHSEKPLTWGLASKTHSGAGAVLSIWCWEACTTVSTQCGERPSANLSFLKTGVEGAGSWAAQKEEQVLWLSRAMLSSQGTDVFQVCRRSDWPCGIQ